jgi:hypothetical protein
MGPRLGVPNITVPRVPAALRPPSAASARPLASSAPLEVTGNAVLQGPLHDDFSRTSLGARYFATSTAWQLEEGRLCARGAHNHPVWLSDRLPTNARIEFDAVSDSPDGDLKVEAWGDGKSAAATLSYTGATSYLFILGGWRNTLHVLARLDEHGKDRAELTLDPESDDPRVLPVEPGTTYHFVIERRDGKTLSFSVNEVKLLNFVDPAPLRGEGHDHFAFNDWETHVCFDNLDIVPLGG